MDGAAPRNQRLVACLHADVSGFRRLIAGDVEATVRTLSLYRSIMVALVAAHGGRVVDTAGDSMLAEFPSADSALHCAIDMQTELGDRNAALPPGRRLEFRLGIDTGRVLVDEGRLYGNCVNNAARVQAVAAPGSVCLGRSAYERLDPSLAVRVQYLGERVVKHRDTPLHVFRLN
jgi:adenylate cyclase